MNLSVPESGQPTFDDFFAPFGVFDDDVAASVTKDLAWEAVKPIAENTSHNSVLLDQPKLNQPFCKLLSIHRKPLMTIMESNLRTLAQALEGTANGTISLPYFVLLMYGKRALHKDAVDVTKLSPIEREIFTRIQRKLLNPIRRKRVMEFIANRRITRRLINYFVVHYLVDNPIEYYLDQRSYPPSILKPFNERNQPEILAAQARGDNIRWINLHQEYKSCKPRDGNKNCHAAYGRSNAVRDDDDQVYSLCEMNFYLWLDSVGGFEVFLEFEADIRKCKQVHDERDRTRQRDAVQRGQKRKKTKLVLRKTMGGNYCTRLVPFQGGERFCTYSLNPPKVSVMVMPTPPPAEEPSRKRRKTSRSKM